MKRDVVSISASATLVEAARLFVEKHVGTLLVVDEVGRLVGNLPVRDLLKLVMPSFVGLIDDFDFLQDFGDFEELQPSPEVASRPVSSVMEDAVSVTADSGLLRAFAILTSHDLYDLPVVDAVGRLVGLASIVDVGTALLAGWFPNS